MLVPFSQRHGYAAVFASVVQRDDLRDATRVELWNIVVLLQQYRDQFATPAEYQPVEAQVVRSLWQSYFQLPLDELPPDHQVWQRVKPVVLQDSLAEVFDLLEFIIQAWSECDTGATQQLLTRAVWAINSVFEAHQVSYRMINHQIILIDTPVEISAVDTALAVVPRHHQARQALRQAVALLEDDTAGGYLQCMNAAITAVEAIVCGVTDAATLCEGLQILQARGVVLPDPVQQAWLDSTAPPQLEETDLAAHQALAKYTLVTCAALVTYIVDTSAALGLFTDSTHCGDTSTQ